MLDYATIEVSNQMFDALLAADDDRLTTAGKLGLPQVLCPGAIEVLVFGPPETVPPQYRSRTMIRHSPQITDIRLNREEMVRVAEEIARRLQHTKEEAVFMIPTAGYDSYAVRGQRFYDPEADRAFAETLAARLPPHIRVDLPRHAHRRPRLRHRGGQHAGAADSRESNHTSPKRMRGMKLASQG